MKEIEKRLLDGELAIFCGAGVSRNSGLPLANELRRCILETLMQTNKDIEQVLKVPYPFEAFSASNKKQLLRYVASAKRPETRQKRIVQIVHAAAQNKSPLA